MALDRSAADGTVAWRDLMAQAVERLAAGGCPDAEISARRIVEEASGHDGAGLVVALDEPATVRGVASLDRMVADRLSGRPLQYVLGRWSFRSLDLLVDPRVLIPRPETEVVAGKALEELTRFASQPAPIVCDLGTGSGAIGLSMVIEHPTAQVWLTDRSEQALAVARANLAGIGRLGTRVNIGQGSWFEALGPDLEDRLSVVVSNPPYVAADEVLPALVADHEPRVALVAGPTGYEDLEAIVEAAPRWLCRSGALVLEMAPHQTDRVATLAERHFAQVDVFDDLAGRARGIVARERSGPPRANR